MMLTTRWRDVGARVALLGRDELREMVEKHARTLHHFARKFIADEESAEELASDAIVSILESGSYNRSKGKFTTYPYRIIRNKYVGRQR